MRLWMPMPISNICRAAESTLRDGCFDARLFNYELASIADVSSEEEQEGVIPLVTQWEEPAEIVAVQALTAAQAHDAATGAHASRLVALAGITANT
jgi:hypothetical protein